MLHPETFFLYRSVQTTLNVVDGPDRWIFLGHIPRCSRFSRLLEFFVVGAGAFDVVQGAAACSCCCPATSTTPRQTLSAPVATVADADIQLR